MWLWFYDCRQFIYYLGFNFYLFLIYLFLMHKETSLLITNLFRTIGTEETFVLFPHLIPSIDRNEETRYIIEPRLWAIEGIQQDWFRQGWSHWCQGPSSIHEVKIRENQSEGSWNDHQRVWCWSRWKPVIWRILPNGTASHQWKHEKACSLQKSSFSLLIQN